jgi:hypothetical protein
MLEFLVLVSSLDRPEMVTTNTGEPYCGVEVYDSQSDEALATFYHTRLQDCIDAYVGAVDIYGRTSNEIALWVPVSMLDSSLDSALKYRGSGRLDDDRGSGRVKELTDDQHCSLERNQGDDRCKE